MFDGKSVLITGGTGTFGAAFARMLLERHRPREVLIYSRDELKQFEMQQRFQSPQMRWYLGDVRDVQRLSQTMRGVDIVIHAAALKQVSAAEHNPTECIRTNVMGAENVISAALENDVGQVVALSTDKAVNPVSLYGASRLASDKIFVAANARAAGRRTRFSVVRCGNVAGSRGSVVPFFRQLIEQGASDLPITHRDMTRFWITPLQTVDFVLRSFERMQGGELFVPKIPSIRIVDLARAMAPALPHRIVGIRPGEKVHEVMCPSELSHLTVEFDDHFVIEPSIRFHHVEFDYTRNGRGETGRPVTEGYEYNSGSNPRFLSVGEIAEYNGAIAH